MDLFFKAKAVRLRNHRKKYLLADDDEESVIQDKNGLSKSAKWVVEPVPGSDSSVRLKSIYGKYLTASNHPFLLGMTGRKVLQTLPRRLESSMEWEPVREGYGGARIKLRTKNYVGGELQETDVTAAVPPKCVKSCPGSNLNTSSQPGVHSQMISRLPSRNTLSLPTASPYLWLVIGEDAAIGEAAGESTGKGDAVGDLPGGGYGLTDVAGVGVGVSEHKQLAGLEPEEVALSSAAVGHRSSTVPSKSQTKATFASR
ncbi:hypothetical protein LINPERHAP2_LOCUS30635 [Linum perenne]